MNIFKYLNLWFQDTLETFKIVFGPKPTERERYLKHAPRTDPWTLCDLCGNSQGHHKIGICKPIYPEFFVSTPGGIKTHSQAIRDYEDLKRNAK